MDSFGFAGAASKCCDGTRMVARVRNFPVWVSVPADQITNFRYRELFRLKGGKIVVQDVLGYRRPIKAVCKDFLLHSVKPE